MIWGNIRQVLTVLLALGTASVATAQTTQSAEILGGMDSGGAGLYGSEMNPWFLQNTPEVTYCLDIDTNAFHQSADIVDKMIQKAVADWREVFVASEIQDPVWVKPYALLRVASQKFVRVPCDDTVDVRFQLGILTADQKKVLGNYRQWIGAAYRTEYKSETMRGKGFVYLAADTGPDKPISSSLVQNVWTQCDGCLLRRTIVHELGHVFGFGHIGNDWDIMSERHLEKVSSQDWFSKHLSTPSDQALFEERSSLSGYLSFPKHYAARDCRTLSEGDSKRRNHLRSIFAIPDSETCFAFVRDKSPTCGDLEATLFTFGAKSYNRYFVPTQCKNAGRSEVAWLYLPPEQNVFKFDSREVMPVKLPIAVAYERTICAGQVRDRNSQRMPVSMSIITSRDGVFAGAAFQPNADVPEVFSSSMD